MKNLILVGPPGAGKGTMSKKLEQEFQYKAISTGDLFRAEAKTGSELGLKIASLIDNGQFVPDEITISILKKSLPENKFILDGFPRNIAQAKKFDEMMKERGHSFVVIYLEVDENKLVNRITKRRVCPTCGFSYHLETRPPKKEDFCDFCESTKLEKRKDDNAELLVTRLMKFKNDTFPLFEYYKQQNKLYVIDSNGTIEEQYTLLKNTLFNI